MFCLPELVVAHVQVHIQPLAGRWDPAAHPPAIHLSSKEGIDPICLLEQRPDDQRLEAPEAAADIEEQLGMAGRGRNLNPANV
jgi:hypothetical protein